MMNTFDGIGIQHRKSRKIYSIDEWNSREFNPDEARGIAVGNGEHSLCLYKNAGKNLLWSSDIERIIPGVYTTPDEYLAANDFHGKENTEAVMKALDDGLIKDAPAFQWVRKTYGPEAYLPAVGELIMISDNKDEISACSDLIDGNLGPIFRKYKWNAWSSTQFSKNDAWFWIDSLMRVCNINKRHQYAFNILVCETL